VEPLTPTCSHGSRRISGQAGLAYRVSPYLSLTADYSYQSWGLGKGPTTLYDLTGATPTTVFAGNASGGNNVSQMVSLGMKVDLTPDPIAHAEAIDRPAVWTGWTVGVTAGFEMQRNNWTTTGLTGSAIPPDPTTATAGFDDTGSRAGLFVGYAWQTGNFVWGIEGDIGKSNTSATFIGIPGTAPAALLAGSPDATVVTAGYDGSLRLRAGFLLVPSLQAYATGGLAIEQIQANASCSFLSGSPWCFGERYGEISKFSFGWTAGVGYEWSLSGNWVTRGEYRYTSLSNVSTTFFTDAPIDSVAAKIEPSNHRLTFGLGYRF
jgi:outer membrane immunogenic protein